MHGPKSAVVACGFALLAAVPAAAEDLTIALSYSGVDPSGRGVTTLFIAANDVRYRTRNYYDGNKDWIFNVASGRLVMIDHDGKRYAESGAEEREEVRRLEREEADTRRLPGLRDGKIEMQAIPPAHPGTFFVEKGSRATQLAGYQCEQYVISTDAAAGPQEPDRRDQIAVWWVTGDLHAPAFFKFQDAVIEQEDVPDIYTWRSAWAQTYDEFKRKGLFPLGRSSALGPRPAAAEAFMGSAPTYGALDMLFGPTSWGAAWIRNDPIDPAIFAIVPKDSTLSAILPASYSKVPSPVETRIARLKEAIESNRRSAQEATAKLKATLDYLDTITTTAKRPPGQ
jgi:hypothetical protein